MKTNTLSVVMRVGLFAVLLPAFAAAADATGTWKWSLPPVEGKPVDVTLVVESHGGALRGTYTESGQGPVPVDVSLTGDTMSFTVEQTAIGVAKYIGRLEDGTVDGLITVVTSAEQTGAPIAWRATKALVPEAPIAGSVR